MRENSEGEYAGAGGRVHRGLPSEVATDVTIMTRAGVERIFRFAFALARSRPRKLLTMVTKSNAQRHAMVMWDEIGAEVAREFADVTWDKMLVDAMTMRMTLRPKSLDTIVASNLHADILSDLAAALAGSLGIAPTANLNPERRFPSMFEPIHGSAFDIAGKGIAGRAYAATIVNLTGAAAASANLAIPPVAMRKSPFYVTVAVEGMSEGGCAVGRTGTVTFEARDGARPNERTATVNSQSADEEDPWLVRPAVF